ncbi:MAG: toxic anion resistance protein [Treponema sp.]|nr:toxic anion resistance protein [Treponema sp.]MBR3549255.1 toxic anion resistance protein [Treponema sp.]MBR7080864.1 toxic anion resistance protein [Treponema sp.]
MESETTTPAPTLTFDAAPAPATPTLTFDASPAPANLPAEKPQEKKEEIVLTPEEKAQVEAFSKQIDLSNSTAILKYGVGAQTKISNFSEKALEAVRTKDMGQVGDMITSLIGELKGFDIDEKEKGIMSLFKKGANKLATLKAKYSKVETNVNVITTELEKHETTLLKDVAMLDQMYEANLSYFKELSMYIAAGKKKLEDTRNGELAELQNKAQQSGLAEDVQAAKDLAAMCDRFEKKIYDLQLTRTIALQTGPQIRMVQSSDTIMAEKIQSTIVNTIPLWKNQMVIAIGIEHSTQAAKAQREVSDMTNALLRKNADALKEATIETVKESERGIVDMETIKHTNEQLISTMDEVLRIQAEGKEKRRNAEQELSQIEQELKNKILEASKA